MRRASLRRLSRLKGNRNETQGLLRNRHSDLVDVIQAERRLASDRELESSLPSRGPLKNGHFVVLQMSPALRLEVAEAWLAKGEQEGASCNFEQVAVSVLLKRWCRWRRVSATRACHSQKPEKRDQSHEVRSLLSEPFEDFRARLCIISRPEVLRGASRGASASGSPCVTAHAAPWGGRAPA